MALQAFHNDPEFKARVVATAQMHVDKDHLVRDDYGHAGPDGEFRGCAVGCTIYSAVGEFMGLSSHQHFPAMVGLPVWLAFLMDDCFEEMDGHEDLVVRVLSAIPVGFDLSSAKHRIAARIYREIVTGPDKFDEGLAGLHDLQADGEQVSWDEWKAVGGTPIHPLVDIANYAADSLTGSEQVVAEAWSKIAQIMIDEISRA